MPRAKGAHIEERIYESDRYIREVSEVIWQLKASAERLEDILKKLKDEDGG